MKEKREKMEDRILSLTLEIICLLTGEDYTVVKKASGECAAPRSYNYGSGGWSSNQNDKTDPTSQCRTSRKNSYQKILEVTNKIIEVLTGEVPIRCEDVTVYFSMEEWQYIEGHMDLYKDITLKEQLPLTQPDRSSNRSPPQKCASPPPSWDSSQEKEEILQDYQGEDFIEYKAEQLFKAKTSVSGDDLCKKEEIPPEISTDPRDTREIQIDDKAREQDKGHVKIKEEEIPMELVIDETQNWNNLEQLPAIYPVGRIEDDLTCYSSEENHLTSNYHPALYGADLSSDPSTGGGWIPDHSLFAPHQAPQRVEEIFPCSECGECFTERAELLSHHKSHMSEQVYSCSECGKCFTESVYLILHERYHAGEKPYSCAECGKWFPQKSSLVAHERVHRVAKPYSCSECGKCFTQKSVLKRHRKSHTGDKAYSCSECGKSFIQKSDVIRHQRTHTGEKPYTCSYCGKCFSQKSILITHERIHAGERLFSCGECGKCFTDRSYLAAHEIIHSRKNP